MKRLCIYLTYDKQNIVDEYIGYMLKELKTCVSTLVVVCNELEVKKGKDILEKYADIIYYRENRGLDVGAFKDVLCNLMGWKEVWQYDELVLVNDSFFGPFKPMKDIFSEMDLKQADFWGLIKHGERMENGFHTSEHIQSFFMTICFDMLHSKQYKDYWEQMPYYRTFMEVVNNYELKFTQKFSELGFKYAVLAETKMNDSSNITNNYIQYSALSYELIKKRKFPFFKKQQISYDVLHMQTQENLRLALEYIENNTDYDVNLIWDNVIRTIDISDIQKNFALQYIISETKNVLAKKASIVIAVSVKYNEALEYVLEYLQLIDDICEIRIYSKNNELLTAYKEYGYSVFDKDNILEIINDVKGFDYICMIHDTDVTSDIEPSCTGKSTLYASWENLVRNKSYIMGVIRQFEEDSRLGYLAPPPPIHSSCFHLLGEGWKGNFLSVTQSLSKNGVSCPISQDKPPFSISINFWIRGEIIKHMNQQDIDDEIVQYLWVYFVQNAGFYAGVCESSTYAVMNEINMQNYLKQVSKQVRELFGEYKDFAGMKKKIFQEKLERFCEKNANIMIYGTGGMVREYSNILSKVSGYIVSDGQPKDKEFEGLPVRYLSEVEEIEKIGIVVCMLPKNQAQVIPLLEARKTKNYICI